MHWVAQFQIHQVEYSIMDSCIDAGSIHPQDHQVHPPVPWLADAGEVLSLNFLHTGSLH